MSEALCGNLGFCAQVIPEEEEEEEQQPPEGEEGEEDLCSDAEEEEGEEQTMQEDPEPVCLAPATSEENLQDGGTASYCYGSQVNPQGGRIKHSAYHVVVSNTQL